MSDSVRIARVRFAGVSVTEKTTWTFVEAYDGDGLRGAAEITCGAATAQAARLMAELAARLGQCDIADDGDIEGLLGLAAADMQADIALATAVSAIRSAACDLLAQKRGISLTEWLGGGAAR